MKELNSSNVDKVVRPERIIQFGEGNFLRGFADWIVNKMNENTDFNGSVVIVQPLAEGMIDALKKQDYLYHVNVQGLQGSNTVNSLELIDSISRGLNPYENFDSYLKLAEQEDIRFIISNTTEAGIEFDERCKLNDAPASSYPGKLLQLIYHRYNFFNGDPSKGLIILPCELIFENGAKLEEALLQYIELWKLDDDFKEWFNKYCNIYSTLVDRIVPGFPRNEIDDIQKRLQYRDNLVVQTEVFYLWVIEAPESLSDEFPADKAGLNVMFVPSEAPYHERKVTLLNAPHTALAPIAYLSGVNIVRDACEHSVIGQYINKLIFDELIQTLDLPEDECKQFANEVLERFKNPYIDHQVTSIMLNAFPKYETRDLPGLKKYLERKGELPQALVLGLAALIKYYQGDRNVYGTPVVPNDSPEIIQLLSKLWATKDLERIVKGVLGAKIIWNEDLNNIPGLAQLLVNQLQLIEEKGMLKTVKHILDK